MTNLSVVADEMYCPYHDKPTSSAWKPQRLYFGKLHSGMQSQQCSQSDRMCSVLVTFKTFCVVQWTELLTFGCLTTRSSWASVALDFPLAESFWSGKGSLAGVQWLWLWSLPIHKSMPSQPKVTATWRAADEPSFVAHSEMSTSLSDTHAWIPAPAFSLFRVVTLLMCIWRACGCNVYIAFQACWPSHDRYIWCSR